MQEHCLPSTAGCPHHRVALDPREVPDEAMPAGTGLDAAGLFTVSPVVGTGTLLVRGVVLLAFLILSRMTSQEFQGHLFQRCGSMVNTW